MSSANDSFDPYAQWLGLNLREQPLDHYLLLGLRRYESDRTLIERQADERMRLVRSFQTGPRGRYTQKLLNEIAAAKLCLLSPASKRAYDEQLALWTQSAGPMPSVVTDAALAGEMLPPAAVPLSGTPPVVLPPPVGVVGSPPFAPPVAPPVTSPATGQEIEGEEEQGGGATGRMALVAGVALGVLLLALAGWAVSAWVLKKPEPELAATSGDMADADQPAADIASPETESKAGRFRPPGTGRPRLPEEGEAIEVLQEGSGDVALSPATAALAGATSLELEGAEEVIAGWGTPDDTATWHFRLIEPGFFQLQITYAAGDAAFGRKLEIAIDDEAKRLELQPSSDGYRTDLLTIAVKKSGRHTLRLRQTNEFDGELRVKLVRLKVVGR